MDGWHRPEVIELVGAELKRSGIDARWDFKSFGRRLNRTLGRVYIEENDAPNRSFEVRIHLDSGIVNRQDLATLERMSRHGQDVPEEAVQVQG